MANLNDATEGLYLISNGISFHTGGLKFIEFLKLSCVTVIKWVCYVIQ